MQKEEFQIIDWIFYELKYNIRNTKFTFKDNISNLVTGHLCDHDIKMYAGRKVLSIEETNTLIYDKIKSGEPFFAGRFGGSELSVITQTLKYQAMPFRVDTRMDVLHNLCVLSGFFPEEQNEGKRFVDLMLSCTGDIDLIGIWNLYMEEWIIKQYTSNINITRLLRLEPWNLEESLKSVKPWSAALEGKKVLVIHPFAKSIETQYINNREKIFSDLSVKNILPEFDLITLKAVQTLGNDTGGYARWFDALDSMIEKIKTIEFDVAIIGCGAYGFPLASTIKKMGKVAIHLGGATQLLFGIKGKRWENSYSAVCDKMMNQYWVRPLPEESVANKKKIEDGCYW